MSEVRIARFVDMKACESIFSEKSTFVLRSPEHYKRLYETTNGKKGDRDEGCAHKVNGRPAEFTGFVASCWTKLEGTKPTHGEWGIFQGSVVAIVSTPSKVCDFLEKAFEFKDRKMLGSQRFPFLSIKHNEVDYDPLNNNGDHNNIINKVPFVKDKRFVKEEEYRFVLTYAQYPHVIDSYIFCSGIDYMEKCFVNPEISKKENKKEKAELQQIVQRAGSYYGDFYGKKPYQIITNVAILF